MIAIKSMTLHNPLFLSGANLGQKLDEKKFGLTMFYQEDKARYVVVYNGKGKFIHESNVADSEPMDMKDLGVPHIGTEVTLPETKTHTPHPMKANISKTAQVTDPTRGMR